MFYLCFDSKVHRFSKKKYQYFFMQHNIDYYCMIHNLVGI